MSKQKITVRVPERYSNRIYNKEGVIIKFGEEKQVDATKQIMQDIDLGYLREVHNPSAGSLPKKESTNIHADDLPEKTTDEKKPSKARLAKKQETDKK